MKKILILLLLASLLIINAACTKSESVSSNEMISGSEIILDGDTATYEGEGVIIESGKITIEKSGSYELKGNYTGEILVDAGDEAEVQLILNGASLNSTEDSAIYVKSSLKTTVVLKDGTNNSISDSSPFIEESEDESENGAIYSKSDLIINGGGNLDINSENKNGIKSKETIEISDGKITITSPADGLNTNEGIEISGGAISITAGDDGIHSEKTVAIAGGQIDILDSEEGIEGLDIVIDGGEININSNDDGINVAGDTEVLTGHGLIINGGNLTVTSEGDGLDSNGDITMYGGTESRKWLEYIQSEVKRMSQLTENLLYMSKMEHAEKIHSEVDLGELCEYLLLGLEAVAYEKKLSLLYEIDEEFKVIGDKEQLTQLIMILLDNGIKFSPPGESVALTIREHYHNIEVKVRNTGATIAEEKIPYIFDRFYKGDESREHISKSYGLGLSIAQMIVKNHNGKITCESDESGTTFTVLIPEK